MRSVLPKAIVVTPAVGAIYAFKTAPSYPSSSRETGRYATLKIIGASKNLIVFAVLDGIWNAFPALADAAEKKILRRYSFAHTGEISVVGTNSKWWNAAALQELTLLGNLCVNDEERELADRTLSYAVGCSYSAPSFASVSAEGEWRWNNDRDAFLAEDEKDQQQQLEKRRAQEIRYRNRLSKLSFDQLLNEKPFERWHPSPPFPPEDFTAAARNSIRTACADVQALGPKPRKKDVRQVLKRCVEWFNDADRVAGYVIETEEREDICACLEEIAFVARHKSLTDEIDSWREW